MRDSLFAALLFACDFFINSVEYSLFEPAVPADIDPVHLFFLFAINSQALHRFIIAGEQTLCLSGAVDIFFRNRKPFSFDRADNANLSLNFIKTKLNSSLNTGKAAL